MKHLLVGILLTFAANAFAASEFPRNLNMLTVDNFNKLSKADQKLYLKKVRQAVVVFEKSFDKKYNFANNSRFNFSVIDEAYADDPPPSGPFGTLPVSQPRLRKDANGNPITPPPTSSVVVIPPVNTSTTNSAAPAAATPPSNTNSTPPATAAAAVTSAPSTATPSTAQPTGPTLLRRKSSPATAIPPGVDVMSDGALSTTPATVRPAASAAARTAASTPAGTTTTPPTASDIVQNYTDRCIIGGAIRHTYKNAEGKYICPTSGRPCDPLGDKGFQCGLIFGNACVERDQKDNISTNCAAAFDKLSDAQKQKTNQDYANNYQHMKDIIEKYNQELCTDKISGPQKEACDVLHDRMHQLTAENGQAALSPSALKCDHTAKNAFRDQIIKQADEISNNSINCKLSTRFVDWNDDSCKINKFSLVDTPKGTAADEYAVQIDASQTDFESGKIKVADLINKMRQGLDAKEYCKLGTPLAKACKENKSVYDPVHVLHAIIGNRTNCPLDIKVVKSEDCKPSIVEIYKYDSETDIGQPAPPAMTYTIDGKKTYVGTEAELQQAIMNRLPPFGNGFCDQGAPVTANLNRASGTIDRSGKSQ